MAAPKPGILSLTIRDKSALYAAYMPFVKNGGLFIPTNKSYKLGDEVFMLLTLMEDKEKLPIAGRIVWIAPKGAQSNRTAGIGVQHPKWGVCYVGGTSSDRISLHSLATGKRLTQKAKPEDCQFLTYCSWRFSR